MNLTRLPNGSFVCPEDPGEPELRTPRVSIAESEIAALQELCRGKRVLEIGTGLGVSTRAINEVADRISTIDVDPWVHENVWPTLGAWIVTATDTREYEDGLMDVIFIDARHTRDAVKRDCLEALRLVRPGGLIILHDFNATEVQEGARSAGVHADLVPSTHGLGVYRVPEAARNEGAAVAVGLALFVGVMWCAIQVMEVS